MHLKREGSDTKGLVVVVWFFWGGGDMRFSLGKRKLVEREECEREGRQREVSCVIVLSYK